MLSDVYTYDACILQIFPGIAKNEMLYLQCYTNKLDILIKQHMFNKTFKQ